MKLFFSALAKILLAYLIAFQKDIDGSLLIDGWHGLALVSLILLGWAIIEVIIPLIKET